jgi:hypothetical protein
MKGKFHLKVNVGTADLGGDEKFENIFTLSLENYPESEFGFPSHEKFEPSFTLFT